MRSNTGNIERIERSGVRVYVSNREVRNFQRFWPCNGIHANARFWFDFAPNGDLVGMFCSHKIDESNAGGAINALCDDALCFVLDMLPEQAIGHRERLRA